MEVVKEDMKLGGLDGGRWLAVETPEGKEEKKRGNRVSAFMCSSVSSALSGGLQVFTVLAFQCRPVEQGQS